MEEMPTPEARRRRRRIRVNNRIRKLAANKPRMMTLAIAFVSVLALLEWRFDLDFSLGILYIFPVMIAATVITRWQIVIAAILCAYTRGLFIMDKTPLEHTLRFAMATIAYTGCGLLIYQITESRRIMMVHYARIRFEQQLRRRTQEQLRLMAESSPAAILTVDAEGKVIAANQAATQMFGSAEGRNVRDMVPMFADALRLPEEISNIRTSANTWARRADGSQFPATAWFSIYGGREAKRLAAIVVDISNEVREREHAHYEDMVHHNRVLAGAVSHEIRNLCSAIAVVQSNLERRAAMQGDEDFEALRKLVSGLSNISSFDLRNQSRAPLAAVDLAGLADELRVIIGQDWYDAGGEVELRIAPGFPSVQADRQGLLQVLLNLSQNALRAVEDQPVRRLTIEATAENDTSRVQVRDTGTGVKDPSMLFKAFRTGSAQHGSGLGLYVSRALVHSFGGELRYVPIENGSCFEIVLRLVAENAANETQQERLMA